MTVIAFLDLEGGSQKATVVVLVLVVGISSPGSKYSQGFHNTQRSATALCIHIRADIAHRSTVSDFPLFSN